MNILRVVHQTYMHSPRQGNVGRLPGVRGWGCAGGGWREGSGGEGVKSNGISAILKDHLKK